jgi:hypothetical protein
MIQFAHKPAWRGVCRLLDSVCDQYNVDSLIVLALLVLSSLCKNIAE